MSAAEDSWKMYKDGDSFSKEEIAYYWLEISCFLMVFQNIKKDNDINDISKYYWIWTKLTIKCTLRNWNTNKWRITDPYLLFLWHFQFSSFVQSCLTLCKSHGLQHTSPPCPPPTPRACSNSCPSSW